MNYEPNRTKLHQIYGLVWFIKPFTSIWFSSNQSQFITDLIFNQNIIKSWIIILFFSRNFQFPPSSLLLYELVSLCRGRPSPLFLSPSPLSLSLLLRHLSLSVCFFLNVFSLYNSSTIVVGTTNNDGFLRSFRVRSMQWRSYIRVVNNSWAFLIVEVNDDVGERTGRMRIRGCVLIWRPRQTEEKREREIN